MHNNQKRNIAIIEPSEFIYEGISASLIKRKQNDSFFHLSDLAEFKTLQSKKDISIVLINPTLVQNQIDEFTKLKSQFPAVHWIAIIYSYYNQSFLYHFDDTFSITDNISKVSEQLSNFYETNSHSSSSTYEELTDREIEILKHLTLGMTNKEVANKLSISTHTVNTHRKNIINKTDIRSLPGLTIFAVSKGIISLETPIP